MILIVAISLKISSSADVVSISSVEWGGSAVDDDSSDVMSTDSVDAHRAADDCPDDAELTDTIVALMSYNIGIHNNELNNKNNWAAKYGALQRDIKAAFEHEVGIQILLLSEFGNMFTSFDEKLNDGLEQPTGILPTPSASSWRTCLQTLGWHTYVS